jgi:hypothetical protein
LAEITSLQVTLDDRLVIEVDDTPRIQRAINSLTNKKGKVILPKGTLNISSPITIPGSSAIHLVGDRHNTIITATSLMSAMIIKQQGWLDGGSIQSLFLECNRKASNGINVEQASQYLIEDIVIQNFLDTGIKLSNTHGQTGAIIYGTKIVRCVITGLHDWFTGTTVTDRPNYAIYFDSMATDNWVKDCVLMNVKQSYVYVGAGGNNAIVENHLYSYPENYSPQYSVDVGKNVVVDDNFFDGGFTHVHLGGSDSRVTNNRFFWNTGTDVINGSTIYDRSQSVGVFVDFLANGNIVENNEFNAYGNTVGYDIKLADANEKRNLIALNLTNSGFTNKFKQLIDYDKNGKISLNTALELLQGDLTLDAGNFISKKNGGSITLKTPNGTDRILTFDDNGALKGFTIQSGTTAQRPTGVWGYYPYIDTTLGKLILKHPVSGWVDALNVNGATV